MEPRLARPRIAHNNERNASLILIEIVLFYISYIDRNYALLRLIYV